MSFGHALLLKRTSQQLRVLLGLEVKGIQLRTRIQGASATLTDLPVSSIGEMQLHRSRQRPDFASLSIDMKQTSIPEFCGNDC